MAKVSANGARSLGVLTTEWHQLSDSQARSSFTLCSDGRVLKKGQWRDREGSRIHSSGLKVWARISKPDNVTLAFLRKRLAYMGYTVAD